MSILCYYLQLFVCLGQVSSTPASPTVAKIQQPAHKMLYIRVKVTLVLHCMKEKLVMRNHLYCSFGMGTDMLTLKRWDKTSYKRFFTSHSSHRKAFRIHIVNKESTTRTVLNINLPLSTKYTHCASTNLHKPIVHLGAHPYYLY